MNKDSNEEITMHEAARLEMEALAKRRAKAQEESDPLAPEPESECEENLESNAPHELYPQEDALGAGTDDVDGHAVILRLQQEVSEANEKMMRAVAETENIRRRAIKEREDASKYSISGFAKELITVSDNLRRALEAVPAEFAENEQLKGLIGGIEATERELLRAFEKNGIKKLDTATGVFNPNHHEVMFETPGTGQPAGTIIQTLEPGYVLHDRLLRPARVGVAKDEASAPPESAGIDTQA